jgi:hypothetical protein
MKRQPGAMSGILLKMSQRLLRAPDAPPTSEAAHVTLFFATTAWNESVGLTHARDGYRHVWETIEADNPALWNELKSNDVDKLIDELVRFKKKRYPGDQRRILTCGIVDSKIRVEWLPAVAPNVDSRWEMKLYGLVRTGDRSGAIRFLSESRNMSHTEAAQRVRVIARQLRLG